MNYLAGFKVLRLGSKTLRNCVILILLGLLTACSSGDTFAPVSDIATIQPIPASGQHTMRPGQSLYEVAWQYGLDYRDLEKRNNLAAAEDVRAGDRIYLRGQAPKPVEQVKVEPAKPVLNHPIARVNDEDPLFLNHPEKPIKQSHPINKKVNLTPIKFSPPPKKAQPSPIMAKKWQWPTYGKIIGTYSSSNKGVNIANAFGTPIYAANAGKVVYSGNGLRGYGNLIIIKHSGEYMSAYAHNSVVRVHEGDMVGQGQKIAEMGSSGTNAIMLHFEIRRNGRPINPASLIKHLA